MPGYVLAKLNMTDDVYHLVKNTPKVTGFLGPGGKPQPIPDARGRAMLIRRRGGGQAAPKQKISVDYEIGDQVKVLDGPFASFNGMVEELDFDRGRVKVQRVDLRPRDAGRARVRAGRTVEVKARARASATRPACAHRCGQAHLGRCRRAEHRPSAPSAPGARCRR